MYRLAATLDPESYHRLARATFAEMVLAGVTCVGEFHYLHHAPGGTPLRRSERARRGDDRRRLRGGPADHAARHVLPRGRDRCRRSAAAGRGRAAPVQRRHGRGVGKPRRRARERTMPRTCAWAPRSTPSGPSTRRRCPTVAAVGRRPRRDAPRPRVRTAGRERAVPPRLQPLAARPARRPAACSSERFTAVHATHVTEHDVSLLATSTSGVCMCPTTERDLADGIGPTARFRDGGVAMCLGSDSHAVIDLFEEARAVELDERLASGVRGTHRVTDLLAAATAAGHRALGWPEAGRIAARRSRRSRRRRPAFAAHRGRGGRRTRSPRSSTRRAPAT